MGVVAHEESLGTDSDRPRDAPREINAGPPGPVGGRGDYQDPEAWGAALEVRIIDELVYAVVTFDGQTRRVSEVLIVFENARVADEYARGRKIADYAIAATRFVDGTTVPVAAS